MSHLCSLQTRRFLRWPLHNVRSVPAFGLMGNSPKGHVRMASQTRKIKGEDDNPSAAPTSASRCTNQNKSKLCNLVMQTCNRPQHYLHRWHTLIAKLKIPGERVQKLASASRGRLSFRKANLIKMTLPVAKDTINYEMKDQFVSERLGLNLCIVSSLYIS